MASLKIGAKVTFVCFRQMSLQAVKFGKGFSAGCSGSDGPEADLLLAVRNAAHLRFLHLVLHDHLHLEENPGNQVDAASVSRWAELDQTI